MRTIIRLTKKGYLEGTASFASNLVPSASALFEKNANKTLTISSGSTDTQYPSAKAVYDHVDSIVGNIESLLAAL